MTSYVPISCEPLDNKSAHALLTARVLCNAPYTQCSHFMSSAMTGVTRCDLLTCTAATTPYLQKAPSSECMTPHWHELNETGETPPLRAGLQADLHCPTKNDFPPQAVRPPPSGPPTQTRPWWVAVTVFMPRAIGFKNAHCSNCNS